MMKNLKNKKHYEDIYDKVTVDHCRKKEKTFKEVYIQLIKDRDKHKMSKETIDDGFFRMMNFMMYYEKAYRFRDREKTIQEMMDRDKLKDERIENTKAPLVNCLKCSSELIPQSIDIELNNKILYMYDCPKGCVPRRSFYEDGEEYIVKDKKCPECNSDIETRTDKSNNNLIITDKCLKCDYKKVWDYSSKKEDEDPDFEKDRKRFCFNDEEGQESIQNIIDMERANKLVREIEEKDKQKDLYDSIKTLPKLSIHDLKNKLDKLLKDNGYSDLIFAQPKMSTDVQVTFTAHDIKSDRGEYDSRQGLKNLIKVSLLNTNWRLMSDGIEYRMGVLKGRLRGFDREQDLLKLEKQKIKDKAKKKT